MKRSFRLLPLVGIFCLNANAASPVLLNGQFEAFDINVGNYNNLYDATTNPDGYIQQYGSSVRVYNENALSIGWQTAAANNGIELWKSATGGGANSSTGFGQFAEVVFTQNAALFQDVTIDQEGAVDYAFSHSARELGTDVLKVLITYLGANGVIGGGDDSVVVDTNYSTTRTTPRTEPNVWVGYTADDAFTSVAGGTYRFSFGVLSVAGNDISQGNFIDDVKFGINAVPEPCAALLGSLGALALLRRRR